VDWEDLLSTMQRLFSPCTRYRDQLESRSSLELAEILRRQPELLQELNLHVSTEDFLSAERAFTYADLYAMLRNQNTVLWLTAHTAVVRADVMDIFSCFYYFTFNIDGQDISALARSPEALSEIVDVVRRLLLANARDVYKLELRCDVYPGEVFFDAPSFAYLVEQCQNLKALRLERIALDEDHCRVLGALSRPGFEIVLKRCQIAVAAGAILAQFLGRNQGPTKLDCCYIDNSVLADGLRGNSRLKSLRPRLSNNHNVDNRDVLAIAGALRENKGLIHLDLHDGFSANKETWDAVCDSLKTHPTLEVLSLGPMQRLGLDQSQIQALVDMMKMNTSIHTIHLHHRIHSELVFFQGSVFPYLRANRLRPRLLAIQKALPIPYRAKVLGRALHAVITDPNRIWMLLSGNAEVAFPSTTATTIAVASLPTSASVAANECGASVVATASTAAASNAVPPAAGQKRKACP
jgi:hypothetical protein